MDYQKELDKYQEMLSPEETKELQRMASMQKDIAVGDSAEDFIRHPFFRSFEQHMNEMINDSSGEIAAALKKPGATMEDLKAIHAGIEKLKELKRWLNKHVIAGRVAKQAVSIYEDDTEKINTKVRDIVSKSNPQ